MRFPDRYEKGSGSIHDLLEPALQVGQGGDVLEATVGERGAVVTLGGSEPVEGAAQPVVVVVLDEASQRHLRFGEAGEALAIEDLLLQHAPEGFDLAVGPRRTDLSSQVLDVEVAQALTEQGEYAGHPDHEGQTVLAHQLQRPTAEFEALVQPSQDGVGLGPRQNPESDHEAGVVVHQANQPGLEVAAAREVDEEGALDVDVLQLIGPQALVTGTWSARHAAAGAALGLEQAIDIAMAHLVDLAPPHLRRDPLRVPVGEKSDGDDDPIHPVGDGRSHAQRSPGLRNQTLNAPSREGGPPAIKGGRRAPDLRAGSCDAHLGGQPTASHSAPDLSETWPRSVVDWPAILGRKEEKARALLVAVTPEEATGVRRCCGVGLRHAGTLLPAFSYLCGNFN